MRKEFKIALIPFVLSLLVIGCTYLWKHYFSQLPKLNEYILLLIFLLVQTKLLGNIKETFLSSNPTLTALKRQIYCFYLDTKDGFSTIYKNVSKINCLHSVSFILAFLGINEALDDPQFAQGKRWLDREAPIPYKTTSKNVKHKIETRISRFHNTRSQYEEIFFGCLSGDLIRSAGKQSIIELILAWLSYFILLTEVFEINLHDHSALLLTITIATIGDAGNRYRLYLKELESNIETLEIFYNQMTQMHACMTEKDGHYTKVNGELIPYIPDFLL